LSKAAFYPDIEVMEKCLNGSIENAEKGSNLTSDLSLLFSASGGYIERH
jgi:hypothetical protein